MRPGRDRRCSACAVLLLFAAPGCRDVSGLSDLSPVAHKCQPDSPPPTTIDELVCNRPDDCAACLEETCGVELAECLKDPECASLWQARLSCTDPVCNIQWGQGPPYRADRAAPSSEQTATWLSCFTRTCSARCRRAGGEGPYAFEDPAVDLACLNYSTAHEGPTRLDIDVNLILSPVEGADVRLCSEESGCSPSQTSSRNPLPSFMPSGPIAPTSWVEVVPPPEAGISQLHRFEWSRPIPGYEEWDTAIVSASGLEDIGTQAGGLDPARGIVFAVFFDCNNRGSSMMVGGMDDQSRLFYIVGASYSDEVDRSSGGLGGAVAVNVLPGKQTLTWFDPESGEPVSFTEVTVVADSLTGVSMFPFHQ